MLAAMGALVMPVVMVVRCLPGTVRLRLDDIDGLLVGALLASTLLPTVALLVVGGREAITRPLDLSDAPHAITVLVDWWSGDARWLLVAALVCLVVLVLLRLGCRVAA